MQGDPLQMALGRELHRGERVLWKGKPIARIKKSAFGLYLFAIPWTAFALFWTTMAWAGARAIADEATWLSYAFPLFGVPFVVVGFGMLAMPFAALWTAPKTIFAVSDERIIKLYLGKRLLTQSVPVERIGMIERVEHRDGSGALSVAIKIGRDSDGDSKTEKFALGEVPDVLAVERHVNDLVDRHRKQLSSSDASRS